MNYFRSNKLSRRIAAIVLCVISFALIAVAQQRKAMNEDWRTPAEISDYRTTPRYTETIAYSERLAAASPLIEYKTFGMSGQGRALPLLIAATDGAFTADKARRQHKAIILLQACIHAGEPDGKDAGLALLRDIAIAKKYSDLLRRVTLLFIPIYNTDGHERFSPYNRINQNGPEEMGWRSNGANLNLNRDYMKADAPETRAWLKLWNAWQPDLLIDAHVTDGADYQYDLTWQLEHHAGVARAIRDWQKEVFEGRVFPATEKDGHLLSQYLEFRDGNDLSKGINGFLATPRFATGYVPLRNRPALLIETHMLKAYKTRVVATYDLVRETLAEINRAPEKLLAAVRAADAETLNDENAANAHAEFALDFRLSEKNVPFNFKGVEYRREKSDISGTERVIYGTRPMEMSIPFYDDLLPTATVALPRAYILPPQWSNVIEILQAHGIEIKRLQKTTEIEVESYRLNEPKFAPASFEGRQRVSYKAEKITEKRLYPVASVLIPVNQTSARIIMHLLEPASPDSLVSWGFFNPIFEQKEYGEAYVLEKLAREMLANNPALKKEFEEKLTNDKAFAANPFMRLNFFYQRSPYWDKQLNLFPVGRMMTVPDSLATSLR